MCRSRGIYPVALSNRRGCVEELCVGPAGARMLLHPQPPSLSFSSLISSPSFSSHSCPGLSTGEGTSWSIDIRERKTTRRLNYTGSFHSKAAAGISSSRCSACDFSTRRAGQLPGQHRVTAGCCPLSRLGRHQPTKPREGSILT